jgi:hypothetical protein
VRTHQRPVGADRTSHGGAGDRDALERHADQDQGGAAGEQNVGDRHAVAGGQTERAQVAIDAHRVPEAVDRGRAEGKRERRRRNPPDERERRPIRQQRLGAEHSGRPGKHEQGDRHDLPQTGDEVRPEIAEAFAPVHVLRPVGKLVVTVARRAHDLELQADHERPEAADHQTAAQAAAGAEQRDEREADQHGEEEKESHTAEGIEPSVGERVGLVAPLLAREIARPQRGLFMERQRALAAERASEQGMPLLDAVRAEHRATSVAAEDRANRGMAYANRGRHREIGRIIAAAIGSRA